MTSFDEVRTKILDLAELPLQRQILGRMTRLVWHKGNSNHHGDHVQDFDFPAAIGMTLTEAIVLYGLVRQSPDTFFSFWEVGTYVGWSTAFMAEAIRKRRPLPGILHTWDMNDEVRDRFMNYTLHWSPLIRQHWGSRGKTPEAFTMEDLGTGGLPPPPDFIFLDGGHHKGQPRADVDGILALDRLESVPTFVFHDTWIADVYDAIEYLTDYHDCQIFEFDTPNQLTVVTKDDRVLDAAHMLHRTHAPFEESIDKGG